MQLLISDEDILDEYEASLIPSLNLAYIGDSVFDMYVRTYLLLNIKEKTAALHSYSSSIVNARSQADFARTIEAHLTEKEKQIFLRARNAKSATVPKNMSVKDYKYATAVEALIGWLYLTGQSERLFELLNGLDLEERLK